MSAPTPNTQTQEAGHGRLGALVRERREARGLSMDQLATRARVSRSSVHRLEHGSDIRSTPSKLANMLAVVGIDADAVRTVLPDDEYRHDVLVWLEQAGQGETLTDQLEAMRHTPVAPDLVAIHGDGTVARIQADGRLDELADALKRAGWLVTRPT